MTFKEIFIVSFYSARKKEKENFNKYLDSLKRTDEEWEILKKYIEKIVLDEARKAYKYSKYNGLFGIWIRMERFSFPYVFDSILIDKEEKVVKSMYELDIPDDKEKKKEFLKNYIVTHVSWMDMKRFCKENNIPIKYGYASFDDVIYTYKFRKDKGPVCSYLLKAPSKTSFFSSIKCR